MPNWRITVRHLDAYIKTPLLVSKSAQPRSCEAGSPFGHYLKWKRCEREQEKVAADHKRKTYIHLYDLKQEAAKSHTHWMKLNGQSSYHHGVFLWLCNAFLWSVYIINLVCVQNRNRDSSVSIATGYRLEGLGLILGRAKFFLFSIASGPAPGPTQRPIQWAPGTISLGVKRPECKDDQLNSI
jgi:hypothetical protein